MRPAQSLRRRLSKFKPPSPPFIEARHYGGSQTPKAIVMHGTVSSDNKGTARNIAQWWHGPTSPITSAHYVVDPAEVIQCVGDHRVAYHCGYNTGSVSIELCDEEVGPKSRWQDADSKAIIQRAARLTAELCLAYNIKAFRPSVAELKAKGPHGIYGHNDSRLAFGFTTHTDPIGFPWAEFLRQVRLEIRNIKLEQSTPKKPATKRHAFVLQTFNVGSATDAQIAAVAKRAHATALQECSDRDAAIEAVKAEGLGVVDKKIAGAPATPLAYDRNHLELVRPIVFQLLKAQRDGPGAGPDRAKAKFFVGGLFKVKGTRRRVIIGSAHNLATQTQPLRKRLALAFVNALNKGLRARVFAVFIGADWNAQQGGFTLKPLHAAGWNFASQLDTHGKRGIDYWVWKDRRKTPGIIKYRFSRVGDGGGSDHDPYMAHFWVTV